MTPEDTPSRIYWSAALLAHLISTWNQDSRLIRPIRARERNDKRNYIGMVNIYFQNPHEIPSFISDLREKIVHKLTTLDENKNEIILRDVSGGLILDQQREDFELLGGFVIEAYGFVSESILMIRVTHEKEKSGEQKQWVSFDVDEQKPSLWFSE